MFVLEDSKVTTCLPYLLLLQIELATVIANFSFQESLLTKLFKSSCTDLQIPPVLLISFEYISNGMFVLV